MKLDIFGVCGMKVNPAGLSAEDCPFCGGEAVLHGNTTMSQNPKRRKTYFWVSCDECGARVMKYSKTPEEATAIWNGRATE